MHRVDAESFFFVCSSSSFDEIYECGNVSCAVETCQDSELLACVFPHYGSVFVLCYSHFGWLVGCYN